MLFRSGHTADRVIAVPQFIPRKMPNNAQKITEQLVMSDERVHPVVQYLDSRMLNIYDCDFYWSDEGGFIDRMIIPLTVNKQIMGYIARKITDGKPKYITEHPAHIVFNLDRQTHERPFVIVCEGTMDAISIDGCAVLGSQIREKQDWLLKRLNKEIILVPDRDHEGLKTVDQAIEYGWSVSMPEWPKGIKDVNDAIVKIGRLATLWLIIESKQNYSLKIQLRAKQFFKEVEL